MDCSSIRFAAHPHLGHGSHFAIATNSSDSSILHSSFPVSLPQRGTRMSLYHRVTSWLESTLFPAIVAYVTNPLIILGTILLLLPLLVWATNTTVVLLSNSYLNVASASVSSIVLLQQLVHHKENRRLHEGNAAQLTALAQQHAEEAARHEDMVAQVVRSHAALAASHDALHAKVDALATPQKVVITQSRDDKGRFTKAAPVVEGASS